MLYNRLANIGLALKASYKSQDGIHAFWLNIIKRTQDFLITEKKDGYRYTGLHYLFANPRIRYCFAYIKGNIRGNTGGKTSKHYKRNLTYIVMILTKKKGNIYGLTPTRQKQGTLTCKQRQPIMIKLWHKFDQSRHTYLEFNLGECSQDDWHFLNNGKLIN